MKIFVNLRNLRIYIIFGCGVSRAMKSVKFADNIFYPFGRDAAPTYENYPAGGAMEVSNPPQFLQHSQSCLYRLVNKRLSRVLVVFHECIPLPATP